MNGEETANVLVGKEMFSIALAQIKDSKDIHENLQNHIRFIQQVAAHGSDFILFPELSLTGYTQEDVLEKTRLLEKIDLYVFSGLEFIAIKTQNLELVPQRLCHLKTTHSYASDRDNMRFMINLPNDSEEETKEFLKAAEAEWKKEKPDFYEFAIFKEENHIGGISLYLDKERKIGELGWCLTKDAQGNGFAFEAAKVLVDWAKTELSVTRFIAHCDSENIASWKTMEKLGMKRVSCSGGRFNKIAPKEERKEFLYEM